MEPCFALTSDMTVTAICNAISSNRTSSLLQERLPYRLDFMLLLLVLTVLALPVLPLLIDRGYRPMADSLSPKERTILFPL